MITRDITRPPAQVSAALASVVGRHVPGVSIAVADRDGVGWSTGAGISDLATRTVATGETVYLWFSMTKIVTATAVMQLAECSALELDGAVAALVPALQSANGAVAVFR